MSFLSHGHLFLITAAALGGIVKIVCLLVAIAFYTLAERKIMAAFQRRLGPNVVGPLGLLQPLADGLKLAGKEFITPTHANSRIFVAAAMATLILALTAWGCIPFGLFDYSTNASNRVVFRLLRDKGSTKN